MINPLFMQASDIMAIYFGPFVVEFRFMIKDMG